MFSRWNSYAFMYLLKDDISKIKKFGKKYNPLSLNWRNHFVRYWLQLWEHHFSSSGLCLSVSIDGIGFQSRSRSSSRLQGTQRPFSEEMEESKYLIDTTFGALDYVILAGSLAISAGIGVYHACVGGRQSTTEEFLMADRNMNPIPVALSLVASFISAITVLGTPAEMYIYGSMYWVYGLAYIFVGFTTGSFFIPIFYKIGGKSVNQVSKITAMESFSNR